MQTAETVLSVLRERMRHKVTGELRKSKGFRVVRRRGARKRTSQTGSTSPRTLSCGLGPNVHDCVSLMAIMTRPPTPLAAASTAGSPSPPPPRKHPTWPTIK